MKMAVFLTYDMTLGKRGKSTHSSMISVSEFIIKAIGEAS